MNGYLVSLLSAVHNFLNLPDGTTTFLRVLQTIRVVNYGLQKPRPRFFDPSLKLLQIRLRLYQCPGQT